MSAAIFNEGCTPLLRMMDVMGIIIGPQAKAAVDARDNARVQKVEAAHTAASKEARSSRRMGRSAQDDFFEHEEGGLHSRLDVSEEIFFLYSTH